MKTNNVRKISSARNTYDIKKIMMGLSLNETQSPGIRFEVVMSEIPEDLQKEVEEEIKKFKERALDIVAVATEQYPTKD